MIVLDLEQGSQEWLQAKLGIPSPSMFSKIITSTGKPSTQANGYMNQLLAEWLAGKPVDQVESTHWMQRGNELEDEARSLYELITDTDVEQVGFVFKDADKRIGCSPDSFAGEGILEIKCPKASTMVEYLLGNKLPAKYKAQVHGQMWITDRPWCDFMAYHPDLGEMIIRVERDGKYITTMSGLLSKFIDEMDAKKLKLKEVMK